MAADIGGTVTGEGPFHVVGHSLGGYLAMTLALTSPEIVRSLTLVATSAGGDDHHPVPEETRRVWLREAGKPPTEYARATMHLSFSPGWADNHPDDYEQWLERRIEFPTPPEAWAAQYEAGANHLQSGLDVEGISVPTLIVHGTADRILPFENSVLLAQRIPTSRLISVEGNGHLIPMERPEIFNSLVFGFWWGVEAS